MNKHNSQIRNHTFNISHWSLERSNTFWTCADLKQNNESKFRDTKFDEVTTNGNSQLVVEVDKAVAVILLRAKLLGITLQGFQDASGKAEADIVSPASANPTPHGATTNEDKTADHG